MPRKHRVDTVNHVCHVINRSAGRTEIFHSPADYLDFFACIRDALEIIPVRIYAFCIMPNHWHLLIAPTADGDLARFMHLLTNKHAKRVQQRAGKLGLGSLYQGRYKSMLVDTEEYFITALRYVECNAVRAGLSARVEDWEWGSAFARMSKSSPMHKFLTDLDFPYNERTLEWLNERMAEEKLNGIRASIKKDRPFGDEGWVRQMITQFSLESTVRERGRPKASGVAII